jgi:hypothetical protein
MTDVVKFSTQHGIPFDTPPVDALSQVGQALPPAGPRQKRIHLIVTPKP